MTHFNLLSKIMLLASFAATFYSYSIVNLSNAKANGVIVQSNGNIVTVGSMTIGGVNQAFIARYTTNGVLDTTFNNTGIATASFGDNTTFNGVVQQSNGQLVAVGSANLSTNPQWIAVRYNANGTIDTNFGDQGFITSVIGILSGANNVGQESDGKIVLSGFSTGVTGSSRFTVIRLTATGALDTGFGTNGVTTTPISSGISANGQAIQPADQKILLAGGTGGGFYVSRYTPTGVLDTAFGYNGTASVNMGGGTTQYVNGLALQSNGNIIIGGLVNDQFALARLTPTGALDTTFGTGGRVYTPLVISSVINSLTLQTDGNLLVAGSSGSQVALARYLTSNGSLDTSYGTAGNGIVLTSIGSFARILGSAIQTSNDALVVVGYTPPNMFVSRYNSTGIVDSNFGVVTSPVACSTALCAYGQVYNVSQIDILNGQLFTFDTNGILNGISHSTSSNTSVVTINQAGTYIVNYFIEASAPAVLQLLQNGVAVSAASFTSEGSAIAVGRAIITANAGDQLSLLNLTGYDIYLTGGNGINASIDIEKIA